MTAPADLVVTNAEVHTLADPDATHEALAVRDGRVVRLGTDYDVSFLAGAGTRELDLGGRVVLPGFVDAHTHMTTTGRSLVHADLSAADSAEEAVALLAKRARETDDGWVLGYGYDESRWPGGASLVREDLDAVSESRPVAAFREDMHVASVNGVALDRVGDAMPAGDVRTGGGEPTGVVVEEAVDVLYEAVAPDVEETRELVRAAQSLANERGVTAVHDMVRNSQAPRVYREFDLAGELTVRVRLNYWADHLDALLEAGLRTDHGSEMVQVGAIKSYTDGTFGGHTAKLSEPYADTEGETGQWVVDPQAVGDLVERADREGFQVSLHAIGDAAVEAVVDAYERTDDPGGMRHRIEHAELADDDLIARIAEAGVVASMQPNFLKWAGEEGLYEERLGERRTRTNRFPDYLVAGANLAFGSDCMPLSPLLGVHHAVNAPARSQRLGVTEALRAYTRGGAYAGFDEDRMGTVGVGYCADLVALGRSPWEHPDDIEDIDVALTVVGGDVVYDGR